MTAELSAAARASTLNFAANQSAGCRAEDCTGGALAPGVNGAAEKRTASGADD